MNCFYIFATFLPYPYIRYKIQRTKHGLCTPLAQSQPIIPLRNPYAYPLL